MLSGIAAVQGGREKQLGMAVSPLMDRQNKGGITRSQVRQASDTSFLSAPLHRSSPSLPPPLLPRPRLHPQSAQSKWIDSKLQNLECRTSNAANLDAFLC